ncbi:sulfoxide reductase catalytic subunit YedY [Ectothiorhodosinus mongolicus]|uniref:Protein-methionine-sulfoxide reductase catalytic subunit MsrP n=1 Tax=Ectothiorhodosinus mongolicus TaxID=233100 RepID=A0A1R3VNR7_9GAMM|nr:protein-methionine-sulfoxide reductase catalytic subunit MsrP [Ectothiorhodosinus mongolicus]ULX57737.1 protein-methionine-sulfoxide reductase catalytic subunit MsrP [Ectothiorhodosinus mongolicus]SIT65595.1 sulfoxide reductase catalytic subunit YedY [Ectothiorhodosinus mongolicus]
MERKNLLTQASAKRASPERVISRRDLIKGSAALGLAGLMPGLISTPAAARLLYGQAIASWTDGTNEEPTDQALASSYNNFFELGTGKSDPKDNAHFLRTEPWSVRIEGEIAKPGLYPLEDLLAGRTLEERIYRLRCVETWSKVIPWVGFPLADLIRRLAPTSRAKYVLFESIMDPDNLPGQRRPALDWPYQEGLRIDEAMHPLTLIAVGMYGEMLPAQNGAPLRLVVPWKYGFKSIKSIARIRFQETQPLSSWEAKQPREYGFYANVNPEVRHPRWLQATERRLGERARIATQMFNGYGDQVAHLYVGMDLSIHF